MKRRDVLAGIATCVLARKAHALKAASEITLFSGGNGPSLNLNFLSGVLDPRITFSRSDPVSGVATCFNAAGSLTAAASNVPRFDHDPTLLTAKGLLVEETRVNSVRNNTMVGAVPGSPGTLPTYWGGVNLAAGLSYSVIGTGTESGIPYIDLQFTGTSTASGNSVTFMPDTATVTASVGQTWTDSIYWRVVGGSVPTNTSIGIYFTVTGGTSSGGTIAAPTTAALATQRVSFSYTMPTGTTGFTPNVYISSNSGTVVNVTIRVGVPQLELGAFVTSPILTSGSIATRAADVATMPVGPWFNPRAGTIVVGVIQGGISPTIQPRIVNFNDGTINNVIEIYLNGALAAVTGQLAVSGVSNQIIGSLSIAAGSIFKAGYSFSSVNQSLVGNGALLGVSGGGLPTVTQMNIGNRADVNRPENGTLQFLKYYPRALSPAELQANTR